MNTENTDPRIGQLIEYLTDIAALDFDHITPPIVSQKYDEIDSLTHTAQMMSEHLRRINLANEDFSILFKLIPQPCLVLSHYGQILQANQRILDRLRYNQRQLENIPFPDLLGPATSIPRDRFVPLVLEGPSSQTFKAELLDIDGTVIPFQLEKRRLPRRNGPSEYLVLALETAPIPRPPSTLPNDANQADKKDTMKTSHTQLTVQEQSDNPANPTSIKLTPREKQVLTCLSQGMTCQQIADQLGTKRRTVESQRGSLYKRFGVNKVAAVIQRANEMGYLKRT